MSGFVDIKAKSITLTDSTTSLLNSSGLTSDNDLTITTAASKTLTIGSLSSTTTLNGPSTAITVTPATDSSTNIATTAFVQGLKALENIWTLLQKFTLGILVSSIQSLTNTTPMNVGTTLTGSTAITLGNTAGGNTIILNGVTSVNTSGAFTNGLYVGNGGSNISLSGNITLNNSSNATITIGRSSGGQTTNINSIALNCGTTTTGSTTTVSGATLNINTTSGATNLGNTTGVLTLASPITPSYAYGSITSAHIGFTLTTYIANDIAITASGQTKTTVGTLSSASSGRWLINCLVIVKGNVSNNMGVYFILYRDTTPLTYAVTMEPPTGGLNTSVNISFVDDIAVGSTGVYTLQAIPNQSTTTASAYTSTSPAINNAGYIQAIRIA